MIQGLFMMKLYKKIIPTNFNENKGTCKMQNFLYFDCILLIFEIALLIAVSICCYLIKYWAKKKKNYYHFTTKIKN